MLCSSPMSIIMSLKMPTFERSLTGMDSPHCSMYCSRPTVFRHTDLPPAFGPEMISMWRSRVSMMSSGTIGFSCFFSASHKSGCFAVIQSTTGFALTSGSMPPVSCANSARARMKSTSASMR